MAPRGLSDFEGVWRVSRIIADAMADREVSFTGQVDFVGDENGLFCEERGLIDIGSGPPLEALRRYYWRSSPGGRVAVFFHDMKPFHSFALQPVAKAVHLCKPDRYEVRYEFGKWPKWQAVWTVKGPKKDYVSTSEYRRDAD